MSQEKPGPGLIDRVDAYLEKMPGFRRDFEAEAERDCAQLADDFYRYGFAMVKDGRRIDPMTIMLDEEPEKPK